MPVAARNDPYRNFRFRVDIDGVSVATFSEVTISDTTHDVIEYRWGDMEPTMYKMNGLIKHANLSLTSGVTDNLDLYNWHKDIGDGKINSSRKKVQVTLLHEDGKDGPQWTFANCWPTKYTAPVGSAKGNEFAIEKLEIVYERIERSK